MEELEQKIATIIQENSHRYVYDFDAKSIATKILELPELKANQIVIQRHNAELEKPEKFKTVIVSGGCAYWDGENWHTRMDSDNVIIQWTVKYWCEMPSV